MAADHFCLRWNNYQSNMVSELDMLRTEEDLVDVTLSCEGHKFRAHKVILSACSPYFRNVFKENPCEHPVVILKDVLPEDVEALLSFVYQGVVYVSEKKLSSFLQTAELLQIKGLAGAASSFNDETTKQTNSGNTGGGASSGSAPSTPVKRRKGAPVRIVKGDEGSPAMASGGDESGPMEADDDVGMKLEGSGDDLMEEVKQEDEGSLGDESGSEGSGDVTASTYASVDIRDDCKDRELLEGISMRVDAMANLLQTPNLVRARTGSLPASPMDSSSTGQFQVVPPPGQGLPELVSPSDRNGKRPCPLCTKIISNKSNLLKHMRIRHSDEYNPACCLLCNKIFKNKYSLRAHLNIYHKEFITPGQPPATGVQAFPNQAQVSKLDVPDVQQQYLPSM